jgi:antitoxin component HigA of HigAB toxin-antitoxin module
VETVIDLPAPRVIRTQEEFDAVVAEIDRLLDLNAPPESPEDDRLDLLSLLVEDYESRHDPIGDSDLTPEDIEAFMADQRRSAGLDA